MDQISRDRIALLHPAIRQRVTDTVAEVDKALTGRATLRIAQGLRTKAEQDAIYAQGRTTKGPNVRPGHPMGDTVSNAKFGQSAHNYGLGIDIVLIIDGKTASWDMRTDWDKDGIADWTEVVNIFKKNSFDWGGNWRSMKDYPHFDIFFHNDWRGFLDKYNKKDFIPGTTYVNL